MPLPECTDLPPLALAIVVLEETLVVGHTVLTEHEAKRSQSVSIMYSNMAGWQVPVAASIAIGPRTSREEIRWAHSQDRVRRGEFMERFERKTYPAMRELVARNIFAVGSEEGAGM